MSKNIIIIGSTGSIGTQALDIVRSNPSDFCIAGLSAYQNKERLDKQVTEFKPKYGGTLNQSDVIEMIKHDDVDIVVFACRGTDMLDALKTSIKLNKHIAIANKEMIVEHGEEIMTLVKNSNCTFVPVDSEHNAIFQILKGRKKDDIEKVILTCSGGPFWNREHLENITVEDALKHPKWNMGTRITIDSATLMNKAIEIIEAKYLFDLDPSQIEVLIHPECIVHGIVHFKDGSSIAHMGFPDMRIPISYALYYPEVKINNLPRFGLANQSLSFYEPDNEKFPSIKMAYDAIDRKKEAALRKSNEKAVEKFIDGELKFAQIFEYVQKHTF